jgi:ankyrin repeat protein
LWVAALKGHLDIVRFLVEGGAAKDQAQNDGATPLLVAAGEGHLDIVRFLVAAGAAKDQARNDGATPFHHL